MSLTHGFVVFLFMTGLSHGGFGQTQLVLLKNEQVLLRLNPGEDFVYRLKNAKQVRTTYVNNLSDTAVVTHLDTVPYHMIDRVYFKKVTFFNRLGVALVIGGTGYFLIDQLNNVVVHGNEAELNESVTTASVAMVAVGLPMMLIKKKYVRVKGRTRLLMVKEGSPFYLDNRPKGYVSPFIPR